MSRISLLYDVFNEVCLDAQMEAYDTSEATLCKLHLPWMKMGDMVLFDRFYASTELMALLQSKGVQYVLRMRKKSWKCVKEFLDSKEKERIVQLPLNGKSKYLLKTKPNLKEGVTVRLIKSRGQDGEIRVFATSLLTDNYKASSIVSLYRQRWSVEEGYKLLKSRLELARFSGKTVQAVQQDFYSKCFMLSLSAILRFKVRSPKVKKDKGSVSKRVRIHNKSYAINRCKIVIKQLYEGIIDIQSIVGEFIRYLADKIEYSRKGQHNKRKKNKGYAKQISMSYKGV